MVDKLRPDELAAFKSALLVVYTLNSWSLFSVASFIFFSAEILRRTGTYALIRPNTPHTSMPGRLCSFSSFRRTSTSWWSSRATAPAFRRGVGRHGPRPADPLNRSTPPPGRAAHPRGARRHGRGRQRLRLVARLAGAAHAARHHAAAHVARGHRRRAIVSTV